MNDATVEKPASSFMAKLYQILDHMRTRPLMYFHAKDVRHLDAWLMGYHFGLRDLDQAAATEIGCFLRDFSHYLHEQHRMRAPGLVAGWCRKVLDATNGDADKGWELFFEMLDHYRQSPPTSGDRP